MHRAVHIYNSLPDFIRVLPKKSFSKESKAHIKAHFSTKYIPKIFDLT
jgi:hypothetical protein